MSQEHLVVVGNGPAGHQAALTLREHEPKSRITLISKHGRACYRPHLLPDLIGGRLEENELSICPRTAYKDQDIKLRSGQEVVSLNPESRELILDHKEVISYSGLILAVGGKPRIPEPLVRVQHLMATLKTMEQAEVWMETLPKVESVLMIGGDLTSFSMTRVLVALGKQVYFVIDEGALWPMRSSEELMRDVSAKLVEMGVEVLNNRRILDISPLPTGGRLVQTDGLRLEVGMVGAFFGLVPDVGFLAGSGLALDRGILVNDFLQTDFSYIYATGDCAQIFHPEIKDYWVSIGYDNALTLGRIAANNLLGQRQRADQVKQSCVFETGGMRTNTSWWLE